MFHPLTLFNRGRRETSVTEPAARDPFYRLQHEVNRLFDDAFAGFPSLAGGWAADAAPRVDICETDKALEIEAELPGVAEDDIDVELTENVLTIRGEKRHEKKDNSRSGYQYFERSYGAFSRSIPLPFEVDGDKVSAEFRNGVLKLSLPKPPEAQRRSRKIDIKRH